jgi:ketosteroid isomerase-like protein
MTGARQDVVERYFALLLAHDFDNLAELLTDDIVRVGPFGDVKSPLVPYLEFLADLMPRLPGYSLELHRVVYAERVAVAEITETIEMDGKAHITPEALVFDLTADGRIRKIQIYIQRLSEDVPALSH